MRFDIRWRLGLSIVACAACGVNTNRQPTRTTTLTTAEWRDDLDQLATELPKRHVNAFHRTTRAAFDSAVAALETAIPGLNQDQIWTRMRQIVASIGDGHTRLGTPENERVLPIAFTWFREDLRVTAAAEGFERLLGASVVRIGTVSRDSAYARATTLVARGETDGWTRLASSRVLRSATVLHGLGLATSSDSVSFTLVLESGPTLTTMLPSVPGNPSPALHSLTSRTSPGFFREERVFASRLLPDSQTVYLAFDQYPDKADFKRISNELLRLVDSARMRRLVVDLRRNAGGDFTKARELLIPGLKRRAVSAPGHVFVLTGPNTFSAAMTNAIDFRRELQAILVGQPTGSRPNNYQEGREFRLAHSGLGVGYSTRYYKFQEADTEGVIPDHVIELTWEDYKSGRDAVLEWVLSQETGRPRPQP